MEAVKRPNYLIIFVILGVSTLIETLASYIQTTVIKLPILVGLALFKVLLVLLYFMHLRYDSKVYSYLFIAGCFLVIPLILVVIFIMPLLV